MRRFAYRLFLSAASVFLSLALHAQAPAYFPGDPNWKQVCAQAVATPLPPEVASPRAASAPDCDAQALYYGFQAAPDYPAALACAARLREKAPGDLGSSGILAGIYANGDGVPRNLPLALRFSCELSGTAAVAETSSRIERLEAMESGKLPASTRFDLCDDATSGMMMGWCTAKEESIDDASRAQRITAIRAKLPPAALAMLPSLQAAETRFENARIRGEYQGGGGSGSAGFALGDQNLLREQFVRNLESFASGKVPHATAAQKAEARHQLDEAARNALARPDSPGEFTHTGIVATQKAWQQLFDAWMRFVPVAFPHLPPDDAATELLHLRMHQLKRL